MVELGLATRYPRTSSYEFATFSLLDGPVTPDREAPGLDAAPRCGDGEWFCLGGLSES